MLKAFMKSFISQYGSWQGIHRVLTGLTVLLWVTILLELAWPVGVPPSETTLADFSGSSPKHSSMSILNMLSIPIESEGQTKRKGLFKPANPLADKPVADSTIERIKSQLKLQCIMVMQNEPVAYINITGVGLRKCKAGDNIQDLFTVIVVNKNNVEITIIGHKVILSL